MQEQLITRRNKGAKVRFNLDSSKRQKTPVPIYLIYRYKKDENGKRLTLKYSVGKKVYKNAWDAKAMRVKVGTRMNQNEADVINDLLVKLEQHCIQMVRVHPDISILDLKTELDYEQGVKRRPKQKSEYSVVEYFEKYIQKSNKHSRTIQKYEGVLNHLRSLQKHTGKQYTFDMMKPEFVEDFANFLYETKESSVNTVSKIIGVLKQVVADAHINGYHNNAGYLGKAFKVSRIKTTKHFLTYEELKKLAEHDLSGNSRLSRVRDLWLVSAYTGLRYSDFSTLSTDDITYKDGTPLLELSTYKGHSTKLDTRVVIPILPELQAILHKYESGFPKAYSSQKMNEYVKELLELVPINRVVEDKSNKAGKMQTEKGPLYKYITNHSGRYTFINMLVNEFQIPIDNVATITGQSLKVIMGYIRKDKNVTAIQVSQGVAKAIAVLNGED